MLSETQTTDTSICIIMTRNYYSNRLAYRSTKGKPQDKIDPVAALINSVYLLDLFNGNIQQ